MTHIDYTHHSKTLSLYIYIYIWDTLPQINTNDIHNKHISEMLFIWLWIADDIVSCFSTPRSSWKFDLCWSFVIYFVSSESRKFKHNVVLLPLSVSAFIHNFPSFPASETIFSEPSWFRSEDDFHFHLIRVIWNVCSILVTAVSLAPWILTVMIFQEHFPTGRTGAPSWTGPMGRGKVELKKIEKPANRQATFSKRRMGLLKKNKVETRWFWWEPKKPAQTGLVYQSVFCRTNQT
jgi:hypothetical protein